jgi:hypothetical protein
MKLPSVSGYMVMKFFIPEVEPERAEEVYKSITDFAAMQGWPAADRRIFKVYYRHHGDYFEAEVGKLARNGEVVWAILESGPYLICTLTRGVMGGMPLLVGRDDVLSVTDFEAAED